MRDAVNLTDAMNLADVVKDIVKMEVDRLGGEVVVLYLSDELTTDSLRAFKEQISSLIAEGFKTILVDCRELGVISSSGLASLLWARTTTRSKGGKIYFTQVSAPIAEVLRITKISTLLSIAPTTRGLLKQLGRIR